MTTHKPRYEVTVRCLVEAYSPEEAEDKLIASLEYSRRINGCPLGLEIVGAPIPNMDSTIPMISLVAPKPNGEPAKPVASAPIKRRGMRRGMAALPDSTQPSRLAALEARQSAWMEGKGERLTDAEIEELCALRRQLSLANR